MDKATVDILHQVKEVVTHPRLNFQEYLAASPMRSANAADQIIALAEELMQVKAARIAQLEAEGPKAYYEDGSLVIVLHRNGKEDFKNFGEWDAMIRCTNNPNVIKSLKLEGPANKDGFIYYIYATPAEMCQRPEGTYISEEEAVILEQRIAEAYAAEFGDDD